MRVSCESMAKAKRKRYYQRWREQHPLFQMYLTKEQYEAIKKLADSQNKTMKEVVLEAISKVVDFEKLRREYESKINVLKKDYESKVNALKREYEAKLDLLKEFIKTIYSCIEYGRVDVCSSVCINVSELGYSRTSMYANSSVKMFSVDRACLWSKLGV